MFEHLNFEKTGFKTSVFEKHFISFSCILFIKFNALRSFCNILLWFSKNYFFQNFDRSKVFFDRSKLWLKILGLVLCVSIDRTYFSINQKLYREFFLKKTFVPHVFFSIQTFPKHVLSLFDWSKNPSKFFVIFLQNFCMVFLL